MRLVIGGVRQMDLSNAHQISSKVIELRERGEYMVKLGKRHPWYWDGKFQYLHYDSFLIGLSFGTRKNAAEFKRDEIPDVIQRLNGLKNYSLIKIK